MGKRSVDQIGLNANHMGRLALASRNQPQWHTARPWAAVLLCTRRLAGCSGGSTMFCKVLDDLCGELEQVPELLECCALRACLCQRTYLVYLGMYLGSCSYCTVFASHNPPIQPSQVRILPHHVKDRVKPLVPALWGL